MLNSNFVLIGILISGFGALSYIIDTLKGEVKPNRVSFFMWALAPLIAFAAEVKQGVGMESLLTLSAGLFPLLILIATFFNKKSEWKITKFDLACGFLSLIGLILWLFTRVGDIAIIFSITADGLAALPTIVKSYKYPETESGWPWITAVISSILTLLTIQTWNFANFGFPFYLFLVDLIIYIEVQFKIGRLLKTKF